MVQPYAGAQVKGQLWVIIEVIRSTAPFEKHGVVPLTRKQYIERVSSIDDVPKVPSIFGIVRNSVYSECIGTY